MSKPFDAMLNNLIDEHLQDWGHYLSDKLGLPQGLVRALDTDLSKTLQADRLFFIEADPPYTIHLEMESSSRLGIPEELLRYNVLARDAAGTDVYSVLMLLRPKANASDLNGQLALGRLAPYLDFRYRVVRIWEEDLASYLSAPGLSPLALLTNEASANLEDAFSRLVGQLRGPNVAEALAKSLLGSAYVLGGLRYSAEKLSKLYEGLAMTLEESTTYQSIINKGVAQGLAQGQLSGRWQAAQELLLRLGTRRFGPPDEVTRERLRTITDVEHLNRMAEAVLDATSWNDILATV